MDLSTSVGSSKTSFRKPTICPMPGSGRCSASHVASSVSPPTIAWNIAVWSCASLLAGRPSYFLRNSSRRARRPLRPLSAMISNHCLTNAARTFGVSAGGAWPAAATSAGFCPFAVDRLAVSPLPAAALADASFGPFLPGARAAGGIAVVDGNAEVDGTVERGPEGTRFSVGKVCAPGDAPEAPFVGLPLTGGPPADVPPAGLPPTGVPPIGAPLTAVPPTGFPPVTGEVVLTCGSVEAGERVRGGASCLRAGRAVFFGVLHGSSSGLPESFPPLSFGGVPAFSFDGESPFGGVPALLPLSPPAVVWLASALPAVVKGTVLISRVSPTRRRTPDVAGVA